MFLEVCFRAYENTDDWYNDFRLAACTKTEAGHFEHSLN